MNEDQIKYNQALARQKDDKAGYRVVKILWTPECHEVTNRAGTVYYFEHSYKIWPVAEVK